MSIELNWHRSKDAKTVVPSVSGQGNTHHDKTIVTQIAPRQTLKLLRTLSVCTLNGRHMETYLS